MQKWGRMLKFRQVLWDLFLIFVMSYYVWIEPRLLWVFPVIAAMRCVMYILDRRALKDRKWYALSIVQEHFKERYDEWQKVQRDKLVEISEEGQKEQAAHIKKYASEIREAWVQHTKTDECDEGLCGHCIFSRFPCRELAREKVCAQKWYNKRKASDVKFEGVKVDWEYLWKLGIEM